MRRADTQTTRRFEDTEGDWIELRVELTKGQRDILGQIQQNFRIDPRALAADPQADYRVESNARVAEYNRALFEFLCVDWSLKDEKGKALQPNALNYATLDQASGEWVDGCMVEVVLEHQRAEGEGRSSSEKPRSSRTSRAKAAGTKSPETV